MPDLHSCKSVPCTYCGFGNEDPPLYPDREKKRAKQATEQRERRKLRERTKIRAGSRTPGLEEEQLQSSNHTAATALGLSLQCSNFSKDQNGPDTPLEKGESSTSPWRGSSERHDQGKHVAEIRPPYPLWRKENFRIGLGSYPTKEAAARAFDVGIYYTGKSVPFNISSPAAFLPLFPANLSFDKLEDVRAIREFVRKEAQNFVAMNEKAKAPSQQVSSLLEKDGDMSLEGIVSPPSSMGSKLPMEDDNFDKLEDVRAIREFVRKEAQNFVAMNEKAKAPSQQVSSLLEKDGDMSLEGIVSPPSSMGSKLPMEDDNFDKLEDVRAIREFVRKEAQDFVAMIEKAKAPSQQVSSLLEKDGDMSLEGIVSPPSSMGSKLPMEDDNFDKLEDVRAIREFVRKEAQDFVAMNEKAKAPSQQVSSLLEKDGDMSLEGIVSPPSSMGSKLPMEDDNFDKLEDVRAIREFVQKEAQDFVAMNEKAKAPYQQVSSLLEKDGDMSLEGIVSPRSSMGSKLPMEDDNGEPLQENYELLTTATPFFSWEWPLRNEAQVSASEEDPWLESFLNSLSDLNQNCMNEEGV